MLRASIAVPFLLAAVCLARAQNPASSQQPPPPPASDPAGSAQASASDPNTKKEKKVWTDENLSDVKGPVSVVGGKEAGKSKRAPGKTADAAYVADVRKKLEKLRGDFDAADQQIAKLRQFNEGEPVGTSDREWRKGYNMQPVGQQIQALEAKKKDIQGKIDALLDEARKKGVEPGQLR